MHFDAHPAFCGFVFDTEILDKLPARCDRRAEFIWHSIVERKQALETMDGAGRMPAKR